jgi:hypothetical protein
MLPYCKAKVVEVSKGLFLLKFGVPFWALAFVFCHNVMWSQVYRVFKEEAFSLKADYEPLSVNTDDWTATQNAWKNLFPNIVIIECFLHTFLKIRNRATKKLAFFFIIAADKTWNCYRAETKRALALSSCLERTRGIIKSPAVRLNKKTMLKIGLKIY